MIVVAVISFAMFLPFCPCCRKKKEEIVNSQAEVGVTFTVKNRCTQFMNCFAGGVILSLTLCHILPEAHDMYIRYLKDNTKE